MATQNIFKSVFFVVVNFMATAAMAQNYVPDSADVKEMWAEELRLHAQNINFEEHSSSAGYKDPYTWVEYQVVGNNPQPVPVKSLKTHGFGLGFTGDFSTVGGGVASGGVYGEWRGRHFAGQMQFLVGQGSPDKTSDDNKKFLQQTLRLQGEVKIIDTPNRTFNVWLLGSAGLKRHTEKTERGVENEVGSVEINKDFSGYTEQFRGGLKLRYTPKWSIAEIQLSGGLTYDRNFRQTDMREKLGGFVNLQVGIRLNKVHKSSAIR